MKKRSQVEPVSATIGALFVVALIFLGGISSYKVLSENRYIGDNSTGQYSNYPGVEINVPEFGNVTAVGNFKTSQLFFQLFFFLIFKK